MEHIVPSRFLLSRKSSVLRLYPAIAQSAGKLTGVCVLITLFDLFLVKMHLENNQAMLYNWYETFT